MTEQSSSKRAVADTDCVVDLMIRELLPVNKLLSIFPLNRFVFVCFCLFLSESLLFLFIREDFLKTASCPAGHLRFLLRLHLDKQNKNKTVLENNASLDGTKPRGK